MASLSLALAKSAVQNLFRVIIDCYICTAVDVVVVELETAVVSDV